MLLLSNGEQLYVYREADSISCNADKTIHYLWTIMLLLFMNTNYTFAYNVKPTKNLLRSLKLCVIDKLLHRFAELNGLHTRFSFMQFENFTDKNGT